MENIMIMALQTLQARVSGAEMEEVEDVVVGTAEAEAAAVEDVKDT